MFAGRNLIIATKHGKEKVIAPIIEKEFGIKCFINPSFDTDILGTFTGEVERKESPIDTLRNKCLMAMNTSNCDLGIASEGSFGPHPTIPFINADDELMIFIDKKNNLEIITRELSTETNFSGMEIKTQTNLNDFAKRALFPSHALILRNKKDSNAKIIKGINDWQTLLIVFDELLNEFGTAYVETDMRAMLNPTRMKIIGNLAEKLKDKINSACPKCNAPGFGVTEAIHGLPCALCNFPTHSTLYHVYRCARCEYTMRKKFPNNRYVEDPMYCDQCNP